MNTIAAMFGKPKAIIAMAHLPALPGQPLYDAERGMGGIIDAVRKDLAVLEDSDVDGILFCNENDRPYRLHADAAQVAAMTVVIDQLRKQVTKPWGVDVLWDPSAAISIASVTGAWFIREVFTGTYAGDFGTWNTDPAAALALRRRLHADDLKLFFNITAEFAAAVAPRPIDVVARGAYFSSLADAICVSGVVTGDAVDIEQLRRAKAAVGNAAVIANTGVKAETIGSMLEVADGVIVGTYLKRDGVTWNPVDPLRVTTLVDAAIASGLWKPGRDAVAGGRS